MTGPAIRVVVCDDVPTLRTLVRYALQDEGDIEVVAEAGDALTGIEKASALQPDVVLLDLSMPGLDALEALPRLQAVAPEAAIVVFSAYAPERMADRVLELGADRYLEKGAELDVVRHTVREAAAARRDGV